MRNRSQHLAEAPDPEDLPPPPPADVVIGQGHDDPSARVPKPNAPTPDDLLVMQAPGRNVVERVRAQNRDSRESLSRAPYEPPHPVPVVQVLPKASWWHRVAGSLRDAMRRLP